MCRLYGFLSNEMTKVDCSLVYSQNALMHQSRFDRFGRDHTDGWGIVTYQDGRPHIRKKTTAAYQDTAFSATAEKSYSTAILAHVRKATVGENSIDNTHPFVIGRWTFAHNGTVTGFRNLEPTLVEQTDSQLQEQRHGETDSEQFFLWLLTRIYNEGVQHQFDDPSSTGKVVDLLTDCIQQLADHCQSAAPGKIPRLNFVLTNGSTLAACRWNNSLHMIQRSGIYDCEICGIPHVHHHENTNHQAAVIASEPVTHEPWVEVPNHSVVVVTQEFHAAV